MMSEGINYVIRQNEVKRKKEVIIVDFQNTGRLNIGSRWSKGLHEFVEIKHNIQPDDESYTTASLSHPAFFTQYQAIYGLTGTIGEDTERVEVKDIYNIDCFDVPPHFPNKRKNLETIICDSIQDHEKKILQEFQIL